MTLSSLNKFDNYCKSSAIATKTGLIPQCGSPIPFRVGDFLRVTTLIVDVNSQRQQVIEALCIKIRNGTGLSMSITLLHQDSVFPYIRMINYYAPTTLKIEVLRSYKVRRANMRYLFKLRGRKAKLVALSGDAKKAVKK